MKKYLICICIIICFCDTTKKKLKTVKKKNMEQPSDLNDITVPVRICKLVDKCYNSNSVNVIKTVMNIANMSSNGTK